MMSRAPYDQTDQKEQVLEIHTNQRPKLEGLFCIIRCRDAGVHAGYVQWWQGREVFITESRRLWYWKPANNSKFLSGVANNGLEEGKLGEPITVLLTETCEIIPCTKVAEISITGWPSDER